jgi:predicted phage baseplate assembly protein
VIDREHATAACGCCETPAEPELHNRPALPALSYRVGTHASFLARMLARLPKQGVSNDGADGLRPLQALTTRARDDAAIALLDAWAMVADVLAFYQERIANEGYLRTATERRSVLELARAIGYELSPGVAASTWLAFTVDEPAVASGAAVPPELRALHAGPGSGMPGRAHLPAGTQVKSVPGPDEKPQTFETIAPLDARAEWNALRPRLRRAQPLDADAPSLWIEGTARDVKPGSWLLFVVPAEGGAMQALARRVVAVTADDAADRTRIDIAAAGSLPAFTPLQKAMLAWQLPVLNVAGVLGGVPLNQATASPLVLQQSWKQKDLAAFIGIHKWQPHALTAFVTGVQRRRAPPPRPSFDLADPEPGVHAFTVAAGPFGHNAPRHGSLPREQRASQGIYEHDWDGDPPSIGEDSQKRAYLEGAGGITPPANFYFERTLPDVLPASWVLIESGGATRPVRVEHAQDASLADFALSGRGTGVVAQNVDGSAVTTPELSDFLVRRTTLHAGSRPLVLAELPIDADIGAGTGEAAQLTLDRLVLDLEPGRAIAVTGERADLPGVLATEVVILDDTVHSEGLSTLFFRTALRHPYVRKTATLSANVTEATHGESVAEVLGSGNGATPNARFMLRRPPLTHVPADTVTGARSTLDLRVNDLGWEETASLYRRPADAHEYALRIDDDDRAVVIFGDGQHGARPPTGAPIVARYRSGIGLEGEVAANTLTILQSRPLGVRDVTNPVAAAGGADPESRAEARANAPRTVRTLERIVSLDDYADFARGFAGIGKAASTALWDGSRRVVAVTIAAANGGPIDESSTLHRKLESAIAEARAGFEPVRVVSFQPLFFDVEAGILADPAHEPDTVMERVEGTLLSAFAFEARAFGRGVSAAEVIALIQSVDGVSAVDLDALHLVTEAASPASPASTLPAHDTHWHDGDMRPAELLMINPAGISLREMAP